MLPVAHKPGGAFRALGRSGSLNFCGSRRRGEQARYLKRRPPTRLQMLTEIAGRETARH